ncbi:hypothetical protein [Jiangella endophytica]|uniref:hypothetical protein n=1 Tax=Jiangella endophytica TaxID=1623398 RepID=UPI001E60451C|nr:hypothetical protein [Jiangella endophytica]
MAVAEVEPAEAQPAVDRAEPLQPFDVAGDERLAVPDGRVRAAVLAVQRGQPSREPRLELVEPVVQVGDVRLFLVGGVVVTARRPGGRVVLLGVDDVPFPKPFGPSQTESSIVPAPGPASSVTLNR